MDHFLHRSTPAGHAHHHQHQARVMQKLGFVGGMQLEGPLTRAIGLHQQQVGVQGQVFQDLAGRAGEFATLQPFPHHKPQVAGLRPGQEHFGGGGDLGVGSLPAQLSQQ